MISTRILLSIGIVLGLCVIVRLLSLRLHQVYRLFSAFLAFEVASTTAVMLGGVLHLRFDYRVVWLALAVPGWVLTLWMVYALLDAILANLPGVLSFSQFLLRIGFVIASAIAVVLVIDLSRSAPPVHGEMGRIALYGLLIERTVSVVALLVLLGISLFVLWFPVQMPRNILLFSIGLTIYFLFRTASILGAAFLPALAERDLREITLVVLPACCAYWMLAISAKGERSKIRVGRSWASPANRQDVIRELERMNAALLRGGKN